MTVEAGLILEEAHQGGGSGRRDLFRSGSPRRSSARIGGGAELERRRRARCWPTANARELTLGVEAVLADGRLYQGLNALKKDSTGYDLKDLLVGAEGTLGFITAATVEAVPDAGGARDGDDQRPLPEGGAAALRICLRERTGSGSPAIEAELQLGGIDLELKHGMLTRGPTASLLALGSAGRGQPQVKGGRTRRVAGGARGGTGLGARRGRGDRRSRRATASPCGRRAS